jgi:hypothetical protein
MKPMKAVFIDSTNHTVTDVVIDGSKFLDENYRLVAPSSEMIEVACCVRDHKDGTHDDIYVDEEGLIHERPTKFFRVLLPGETLKFSCDHRTYAGNGLITGLNPRTGRAIDAKITAKEVVPMINFLTLLRNDGGGSKFSISLPGQTKMEDGHE